ncbi:hypothetical protein BVX98_00990, partial [bacterium F11]
MMVLEPRLLFANATRTNDVQPWGKAFSYSIFVHSALLLFLLVTGFQKQSEIKTVLTEIRFIEKAVPIKKKAKLPSAPVKAKMVSDATTKKKVKHKPSRVQQKRIS